ncbi:MAG: alpha/beta fold hydrolase [Acidobacteriota bacterium]
MNALPQRSLRRADLQPLSPQRLCTAFSALCLLGLGLLLATPGLAQQEAASQSAATAVPLELEDCVLGTGSTVIDARCAKVPVPENWQQPDGRQIELSLAVIPAQSDEPAPDPLVPLAGGPGQAILEVYPAIAGSFRGINRERDIVLLDQRGTGESHPFPCFPDTEDPAELLSQPSDEELEGHFQGCLDAFDGNPRYYTTVEAVKDLEHVLDRLGAPQANFLGVSYGTRLGLAFLRELPDRVRTLTLDAVVDWNFVVGDTFGRDAERAFQNLLRRCAADRGCSQAYPQLEEDFEALYRRLQERGPQLVRFAHPRTAEMIEAEIGWGQVSGLLRALLYSPQSTALVPLLIHDALKNDDLGRFAARAIAVSEPEDLMMYQGLFFSVICSEDWPELKDRPVVDAETQRANALFAGEFVRSVRIGCGIWPSNPAPPELRQPVTADVPTLLLSGPDDPVTPPTYAQTVAASLPSSLALEIPGGAHGALGVHCVPRLLRRFIESGELATIEAGAAEAAGGIDASCLKKGGPEPVFTSFAGPAP